MRASAVAQALSLVSPAEQAFKSRWRFSTLERIDADLAQAVNEQQALYDSALLKGSDADVRIQSEAMVRGWRAACQRMENPLQPDDAYFVGFDVVTGTKVCIADHKGCQARAQQVEGQQVIFVTPDEVARLMGGVSAITKIKGAFPDAEIMNLDEEWNHEA
ncbi:hypothetical protein [Sphingobium sp. HDIP04]|uniref:hypothetical protein n=1 Tax=Sphingobium sp. HDIP04 TaxID=428994 RepID=UPI00038798F0|nr:hypothetical protein [Sphingobium sp. HDIP04]EQB03903.1 hypothetical protein L286_11095 [Sphingobium sp. HDIP04]